MTLTIERENAASMLAAIVKEGLTFEAREEGSYIIITFTGGY
jgi:hypothetical protein